MEQDKIATIIICGPTASGKTELALKLANHFDIEIISADSRQIYKYLNIGTAKPTERELNLVKHHLIDFLEPDKNYSAGQFGNYAYQILLDIYSRGKIPVVVGGSGLYIKSLIDGLFMQVDDSFDITIRKDLENELFENGIEPLYEKLKIIDPKLYELYNDKNPRRIIRALEYYRQYGKPLSAEWKTKQVRSKIIPYYFCVDDERSILYKRINVRTQKMWTNGLIEETKNILNMGYSPSLNSLNTVGYKEAIDFLNKKLTDKQAIEKIQQHTRNYAKRQITWLNKISNVCFLNREIALLQLQMKFNKIFDYKQK